VVKHPRLRAALIGAASTIVAIIVLKLLAWASNSSAANLFDYLYENVQLGVSAKIAAIIPASGMPWPEMPALTFILLVLVGASASLCRKAIPAALITIVAFLALASWGETARQAQWEYWLSHRVPFSTFSANNAPPCSSSKEPAKCEARKSYVAGLIYYEAGDLLKAEKEWERAQSFDSTNQEVVIALERIRLARGRPLKAKSELKSPSKKST
jgi:hypothetical protein